jgi:hypothetical protein
LRIAAQGAGRGMALRISPIYKEKVPQGPPSQQDPATLSIAIEDTINNIAGMGTRNSYIGDDLYSVASHAPRELAC